MKTTSMFLYTIYVFKIKLKRVVYHSKVIKQVGNANKDKFNKLYNNN